MSLKFFFFVCGIWLCVGTAIIAFGKTASAVLIDREVITVDRCFKLLSYVKTAFACMRFW